MDQKKIGNFIATQRKTKNLTQEQIANKLSISINAVSKWERGLCLMDMSLLKPLSEILDVSINDILAGEKINQNDILKKSEENIIKISKLYNLKEIKNGSLSAIVLTSILIILCLFKGITSTGFIAILCAFTSITYKSKYTITKDHLYYKLFIIDLCACILNTIAFIVNIW